MDDRRVVYDPFVDPRATQHVGAALAELARPLEPTGVLAWDDGVDLTLAFVVGLALGVPIVPCYDDDGLAAHDGVIPEGSRLVAVADAFPSFPSLRALQALTERDGGRLVGAVAVRATPALTGTGIPGRALAGMAGAGTPDREAR